MYSRFLGWLPHILPYGPKLVKLCSVFHNFRAEKLCPPLPSLTYTVLDRPWGARLRKLGPICHGWPPQVRQDTRCQARKYPPALYCWPPWTDQTQGCQAEQDPLTHLWLPDRGTVPPLLWLVFSGTRVIGQGSCAQSFTDVLPGACHALVCQAVEAVQIFHIWPPSRQPGHWLPGQGNCIPLPWLVSTGQA